MPKGNEVDDLTLVDPDRRRLLTTAVACLLSACVTAPAPEKRPKIKMTPIIPDDDNTVRLFAPSSYLPDPERADIAAERLAAAGFALSNLSCAYRRFQRFAGTDTERAADLQAIARGLLPTPKILLGARGGYGAARILPMVDWASLGARMRERGTWLLGFSDVCAVQLALLAKSGMMSFAGPMLYSEFGKAQLPEYTMARFVAAASDTQPLIISGTDEYARSLDIEGIFWGGNLSVLVSLAGSPYFPDIPGGILFLEDVSEQPYRIDRMLQQLYLSGCLKKQRAVVLGNFRLPENADIYDKAYDFPMVVAHWQRKTGIPFMQGFPFGHVAQKSTFPLGIPARLRCDNGMYSLTFNSFPRLRADKLRLDTLLMPTLPEGEETNEEV